MSFSQKVTRLLKENGMTKATLAKESGIPYTTLDSMLKRETDTARLETIFRIAKALGTSVEALVFDGEEKDTLSSDEKRILDLYSLLDDRGRDTVLSILESQAHLTREEKIRRSLPVFRAPAAAGEALPILTEEKEEMEYWEGQIPPSATFGIRISGDSMEPLFSDGDLVYVKPATDVFSGQIGIFILNGESLCKKFWKEGDRTYLVSLNPKYAPIPVLESDELKLAGIVIAE